MIHASKTGFTAGTVILAAGHQPRHHEFQDSLSNLLVPTGTAFRLVQSCDVAGNFNKGVRLLAGEWAWFLGDDHEFAPDTLLRLLARDVDVVVPITPCKQPFGYPFVLHGVNGEWRDDLQTYSWAELSGTDLKPLAKGDFVGQAGMLVKRHILDRMGYPWFKCGQFDKGRLQEDMWFCHELQELGYTVWLDPAIVFDHYMWTKVTARRVGGVWTPTLDFNTHVLVLQGLESSVVMA